jgi:hypothetical protein
MSNFNKREGENNDSERASQVARTEAAAAAAPAAPASSSSDDSQEEEASLTYVPVSPAETTDDDSEVSVARSLLAQRGASAGSSSSNSASPTPVGPSNAEDQQWLSASQQNTHRRTRVGAEFQVASLPSPAEFNNKPKPS